MSASSMASMTRASTSASAPRSSAARRSAYESERVDAPSDASVRSFSFRSSVGVMSAPYRAGAAAKS
jgi:hypothetical protein